VDELSDRVLHVGVMSQESVATGLNRHEHPRFVVKRLAVAGVDAGISSRRGPRAGPVGNGKMASVGAFMVPRNLAEALDGEGRAAWLAGFAGSGEGASKAVVAEHW
jgi:hypothetical protein